MVDTLKDDVTRFSAMESALITSLLLLHSVNGIGEINGHY